MPLAMFLGMKSRLRQFFHFYVYKKCVKEATILLILKTQRRPRRALSSMVLLNQILPRVGVGGTPFLVLNEYFFELNPRKNTVLNNFFELNRRKNPVLNNIFELNLFRNTKMNNFLNWIFQKKKIWIIFELNIFGKLSFEYFFNWFFGRKTIGWISLWIDI